MNMKMRLKNKLMYGKFPKKALKVKNQKKLKITRLMMKIKLQNPKYNKKGWSNSSKQ